MLRPESEAELSELVAQAAGPLAVQGGGTRIGAPAKDHVGLSASGLSGITLYEPGALTIVVGAGTPLAEVEAALDAEGQRLAFEPMDHRGLLGRVGTPTIGGVVAGNVSGPRRVSVGACRDFLLGVRFVDGQGRIIKNGGRVMKNVTGYDLVKLMAGSFGTLGVLSEVSLKVLPKTEMTNVLCITGLTDQDGVRAMSQALGSPYELTGAAHAPVGPDGEAATVFRLEGFESSVQYRAGKLAGLLGKFGQVEIETDQQKNQNLWQWFRDVRPFHGQGGDVWRISVKPTDGPGVGHALQGAELIYDWGGGLVWAQTKPGFDVRTRLREFQGHATLVRANEATLAKFTTFQPEPAPIAAITAGLRARFDPRDILNPGLMG